MAGAGSGGSGNVFLALLCHDWIARYSRHGWDWHHAGVGPACWTRKIYNRQLRASRDRRSLLAFCGHRLDFSFPAIVSGRSPLMKTTTHSPKLYWKNCGALMLLLALTSSVAYVDLGMFNLVVALAIGIT